MTDQNQPPSFISGKDLPEGFEPDKINTATYKGWRYAWDSDSKGYFRIRRAPKYFLLAGDEVSQIMGDEGFDELVNRLQNEDEHEYLFFDLHEYKSDNSEEPEQILDTLTANNLTDYFIITEEEYQILSNL